MKRKHWVLQAAAMLLAVSTLVSLPMSGASAALLEIEFTGLEIEYDGTDIFDAGGIAGGNGDPAESDMLTSMAFTLDNILIDTLVIDLAADIFIPDVLMIPEAGGEVTTVAGGFFDLLTDTTVPGFGLQLAIQSFEVMYTGLEINVFGHGVAVEVAQNLPFGLMVVPGDTVSISFSTQIDSIHDDSTHLTDFLARGTGEVRAENIPEPGTLTLALLGCLAMMLMVAGRRHG